MWVLYKKCKTPSTIFAYILCHIRFAMTTLPKFGLCLTLALHTFISLMSSPLKLLPYTKRFQTSSMLVFSKYYNKKIKESNFFKKQMEKKNPWMLCCERSQQILNKVLCCLLALIQPNSFLLDA
jgi:hypothetical protein